MNPPPAPKGGARKAAPVSHLAGFFIGRSIKKGIERNGAGPPYAGADVILVAQNATYTIKHEARISAGQKQEQAGMRASREAGSTWENKSNEVA
jgi:hypothetical protein